MTKEKWMSNLMNSFPKAAALLMVVDTQREQATRIISFRSASSKERETYNEWLENQ